MGCCFSLFISLFALSETIPASWPTTTEWGGTAKWLVLYAPSPLRTIARKSFRPLEAGPDLGDPEQHWTSWYSTVTIPDPWPPKAREADS